ncbi:glypican-6-like [Antedon mediterranea]|uniref:glypican-6-like n=1 Tax=Antedon mediterranea TaxID=105859 RepID=UPI003AF5748F
MALPGEHKSTCGTGFSCCTADMEYKLTEKAEDEFKANLYEASFLVRDSYVSKSEKFDGYFLELLDQSESDFTKMFEHTYGDLYKDHKDIFSDLYVDLRQFYQGKIDDLEKALDDFFGSLLLKMFTLLNPGVHSDEFMVCITENMDELKPFGTIPEALSTQMRRSLNAARTYVQGLDAARDIVIKATKESPTQECKSALMKMDYCSSCKGISSDVAPCDGLCTNIMKACLAQQAELQTEWTKFIEHMLKLGGRMGASFNIETVIDSINVKISEGIMNYQENTQHVTEKSFEKCGHLVRKRRSSEPNKKKLDKKSDWSRYRPQGNNNPSSTALGATLNGYIAETAEMLKNSINFWADLPYLMCNDDNYAAEASNQNCWTGIEIGNYDRPIVKSGLEFQGNNSEVDMVSRIRSPSTLEYKALLKDITAQLNHAYTGRNTKFISLVPDDEDYDEEGSGSGSGSGSGDGSVNDITVTTIDNDPKYRPTKFPDNAAPSQATITLSVLIFSMLFSCLFRGH